MRVVLLAALSLAVASPSLAASKHAYAKDHAPAGAAGRSVGGGSAIAPAWSSGMEPIGQARTAKAAGTPGFTDPALASAKPHRTVAANAYGRTKTRRAY